MTRHNVHVLADPPPAEVVWSAGWLTNRAELESVLGLSGAASDGEVVSAAAARWGAAAGPRLRGAWGYAVDDGDGLLIVRDQLGLMPVYWSRTEDGVVVADSLAEVLAARPGDIAAEAEFAWATKARALATVATRTPAAGVHRVPPGCAVRIQGREAAVTRWWLPEEVPKVRGMSVDQAADGLRALLLDVIADHVEAALRGEPHDDVSAIAAHLSGGLDSTAVALLVQRELASRGRTLAAVVSWSPDPVSLPSLDSADIAYDERALVQELAAEHDLPVIFGHRELGEADWLARIDPVRLPRSTLNRESTILPRYAEFGVRQVFSGWGGDEFASFNGRMTNRALVRSARIGPVRSAYRELRSRGRTRAQAASDLALEALPSGDPWDRLRGGRRQEPRTSEKFIASTGHEHPELVAAQRAHRVRLRSAGSPRGVQEALIANDHLARRIESWREAGLLFGVEYRYPLLDVRLVEWALSMPPEVFRLGGHTRLVFRKALDGLVPEHIRMTSKDDPVLLELVRRTRADRESAADG